MGELNRHPGTPDDDGSSGDQSGNTSGDKSGDQPSAYGDQHGHHPHRPPLRPEDRGTTNDPNALWDAIRRSETFDKSGDRPRPPRGDQPGDRTDDQRRTGDDRSGSDRPRPGDAPGPPPESPKVAEHTEQLADLARQVKYDSGRFNGLSQAINRTERKYESLAKRVDDLARNQERTPAPAPDRPREPDDSRRDDAPARPRESEAPRPAEPDNSAVAALSERLSRTERSAANAEMNSITTKNKADRTDQKLDQTEQRVTGVEQKSEKTDQRVTELQQKHAQEIAAVKQESEQKLAEAKQEFEEKLAEERAGREADKREHAKEIASLKDTIKAELLAELRQDGGPRAPDASRVDRPATAGPEREQRADKPDRPRIWTSNEAVGFGGMAAGGALTLAQYYGPGLAHLVPAIADFVPSAEFTTPAGVAIGVGTAALALVRSIRKGKNAN